jgi:hypothetical protein
MARGEAIDALRERHAEPGRDDLELLLQWVDSSESIAQRHPGLPVVDAQERRVLRLAYTSGAMPAELAVPLGLSAAAVRRQLHTGLLALAPAGGQPAKIVRAELMAGLFVLGSQSQRVRRRQRAAHARDPQARRLLLQWEARLAPLGEDPPPVRPEASAWGQIAGQLENKDRREAGRKPSRWLWIAALMLAGAMAWALLRTTG